jgi:PhzF family phenazine biosynthesis protein
MVRVFLCDAFPDGAFGGNVAGVVLDSSGMSSAKMQRIASELNGPAAGFMVDHQDGHTPVFAICYFTPRQQIGLCGHVAVATFTALVEEGRCKSQDESTRVLQRTRAGELLLDLWSAEENGVIVEMQQRLPSIERPSLETNGFRRALGDLPLDPRLPWEIASTGLRHLVVPYARVDDLPHLSPDYTEVAGISRALRVETVCALAVSPETAVHVRLRDFCPRMGANEERASGTTSGALASYLIRHGALLAESSGEVCPCSSGCGDELAEPDRGQAALGEWRSRTRECAG